MQPNHNHLVWDSDPVMFTVPEVLLPFPISIWGLVAGAVLLYYSWNRTIPADVEKRKTIPAWKPWGVILGSLVAGQLPFLFIGGPVIDAIGPIEPRWYGLMFASAFIFGYLLVAKILKDGARTHEEIDRLLIFILIASVVGARLGHVIFYDLDYYLQNPQLIPAIWLGGLASHGAAIAIILAMWLFVRNTPNMTFYWLADRVVPGVALGGMFIRIGNFFNSEILGQASDVPWAVVFTRIDNIPRHPSMLYESLSTVVVLAVLMAIYYRYDKKPPEGSLFGSFLVLLFSGRFLIEFTKLHHAGFEADLMLNMGQWLSIPLILFGVWLLAVKVDWKGWEKPAETGNK